MSVDAIASVSDRPLSEAPFVQYDVDEVEPLEVAIVNALDEGEVDRPDGWTLNEEIDADALGRLFADRDNDAPRGAGVVGFRVDDVTVAIDAGTRPVVELYEFADA